MIDQYPKPQGKLSRKGYILVNPESLLMGIRDDLHSIFNTICFDQ